MSTDDARESNAPPQARGKRSGVALCLSGGGYRALLFHLGALKRLRELGVLEKITTFSSVSGGSIMAAFLADAAIRRQSWDDALPEMEEQILWLVKKDIRTIPAVAGLPYGPFGTGLLMQTYRRHVTKYTLRDLPEHPEFVFCATDMVFGVNWESGRSRVGDYAAGYARPAPDWPIAKAVAASSCFPPVFRAMPVRLRASDMEGGAYQPKEERDRLIPKIRLSDGGVYDNMALEPVWGEGDRHEYLLVSDGGQPLHAETPLMPWKKLLRYSSISMNQSEAVRKRWIIETFRSGNPERPKGTYWGIGSAPERYNDRLHQFRGYSKTLAKRWIARIRTDLATFTDAEAAILMNHGYHLAEAAINRHVPCLNLTHEKLHPSHPEWMDHEDKVANALKNSDTRPWVGRLFVARPNASHRA